MFTNHIYLIYTYKEDLALNNLQWLIRYKPKQKPNQVKIIEYYNHVSKQIKALCLMFYVCFSFEQISIIYMIEINH